MTSVGKHTECIQDFECALVIMFVAWTSQNMNVVLKQCVALFLIMKGQEMAVWVFHGVSKNRGGPPKWMVYNGTSY